MINLIEAPTLDDALAALAARVAENESRGGKNFIFCEDRLTLLAEHAVLGGNGGTFLTEVSTFARFLSSDRKVLSKYGSVMAVSAILSARSGELRCFKNGSAQAVYETIAQLAASRVSAEKLRAGALETEGLLRAKLEDLALVLEAYEEFLRERGLLDENGYLALLPEKIASGALADGNVFFFAFPSFTAQAREGLRAAMEHARSVTGIFLAGDGEPYTNEGAAGFERVAAEYGGVRRSSVPCSLADDALILRDGLYSPERYLRGAKKTDCIRTYRASDDAEEFGAVCALIRKHVAEDGLRYRDFAVLVPDKNSFLLAEKYFRAHGIPFFADRRKSFSQHPFCAFALACLEAAADGGLPLSADAVAANVYFGNGDNYRNYLLKYGGYRGGIRRAIKEGEAVKGYGRDELIACREKMLACLALFPAKGTGKRYADAVRALYELVGGEAVTQTLTDGLSGEDQKFLSLAPLDGVLAETETVAGGLTLTVREFVALLSGGLDALEVSVIPQSADAVFVGDITESKFARAEVLFCTGLTDALPRVSADTALISDGDIGKLSALAVEIEPAIATVNARARESIALNVCSFRRALYLSRPLRAGDAETGESEILSCAEKIFQTAPMPALYPYNCTQYAPALLELIALKQDVASGREYADGRFSALYTLLKSRIGEEALEALLSGREKERVPQAAELYFSRDASPTLIENYFVCPYKSFAVRALRLREREERTVLDTDAGTFVHAVLERVAVLFNELTGEEECRLRAVEAGRELLGSPRFVSLTDTQAGAYTGERLVREAADAATAAYRQIAQSGFRVRGTEVKLTMPALRMSGKADRVDEAGEYVRIIDYKTGETDDTPLSYYTGRKVQLQLYLSAARAGGKPAGAFYFPAADEFTKTQEEKYRMSGFFSKEDEVLALMDSLRKEGEKSAFFEGGGRTEKGMEQDRFEEFLDYAELLSARAEDEMRDGNVAPSPYGDACAYCKCLGACGFTGAPRKEESVRCADIVSVVKRAKEGE